MKRIMSVILIILILFSVSITSYAKDLVLNYDGVAYKYNGIVYKMVVNGKTIKCDLPPLVINRKTLIPVRNAFEGLGASAKWDTKVQKFFIVYGKTKIEFKANSNIVNLNGKTVTMDSAAKLINGRLMIPYSFLSLRLNIKVVVSASKKLITLESKSTTSNALDVKSPQASPKPSPKPSPKTSPKPYSNLSSSTSSKLGSLDSIKYSLKPYQFEVSIGLSDYKDFKTFFLSNPDRLVLDITNTKLKSDIPNIKVNGSFVKEIRSSQFQVGTVRIVMDTSGQFKYEVLKKDGQLIVNMVADRNSGTDRGGLDRGDKLADDVSGSVTTIANGNNASGNNAQGGTIASSTPSSSTGPSPSPITTATPKPGASPSPNSEYSSSPSPTLSATPNPANDLGYVSSTNPDAGYGSVIYTDPNLYLDLGLYPDTGTGSNFYPDTGASPDPSLNTGSSSSPYPDTSTTLSPTPSSSPNYSPNVNSVYYARNLKYSIVGDRVSLTLSNSKLTEGGSTLKKLYTESYDVTGNKYIVSFPNAAANLDAGIINIGDNYMNSIEVLKDFNQTSIIFNAKEKFSYNIFSRSELSDTAITILKPVTAGEKLVVIDAGHGGFDPGAVSSGVKEKDLNLDIALRLNEVLKRNNVKTYILRSDDSFLGLYERTGIANKLNATLFISIHNNAFNSETKGTETLYYNPSGDNLSFTSKMFAQNIQTSLIMALGSVDRKIVYRSDLAVLKGTAMIAALVEVGFITNTEERANLINSEYRQKAAIAMSDAISRSLLMIAPF